MRYRENVKTRPLLARFILGYVLLTVGNLSIFAVLVFENQLSLVTENAVLRSQLVGARIAAQLDESELTREGVSVAQIRRLLERAGLPRTQALRIYDSFGSLLFAYDGTAVHDDRTATDAEVRAVQSAVTQRAFTDALYGAEVDADARSAQLYVPFAGEDAAELVAGVAIPLPGIGADLQRLYRQVAVVAVVVIVFHLAFAAFASARIFRPLRALKGAIDRIADGDLDTSVPIRTRDEFGWVSGAINEMTIRLRRLQDEARWANPLTGLPGNPAIQAAIQAAIDEERPSAVLYADVDNFKPLNDYYSYERGDQVILFLRDCMRRAAEETAPRAFLGHEGGDDFVLVCRLGEEEALGRRLCTLFDEGIGAFYDEIDRQRGTIRAEDRQGRMIEYSFISVSVACVPVGTGKIMSPGEVAAAVGELKRIAKTREGSVFVSDRRVG